MSDQSQPTLNSQQRCVAFIHPSFHFGGAQQLILDLTQAVRESAIDTHIFTTSYAKQHLKNNESSQTGGKKGQFKIYEHGSFWGLIPQSVFGLFQGWLVTLRTIVLTMWMLAYSSVDYQVVVVDQVSLVVPLLWLFGHKVIFYCHFPDKMLVQQGNSSQCHNRSIVRKVIGLLISILRKIYRFPLNTLEELSLLFPHKIYVNSQFTRTVFKNNYKIIMKFWKLRGRNPANMLEVLYPAAHLDSVGSSQNDDKHNNKLLTTTTTQLLPQLKPHHYFLSLNRFQPQKKIYMAIKSYGRMATQLLSNNLSFKDSLGNQAINKKYIQFPSLVLAGGYNYGNTTVKAYLQLLIQLASKTLNQVAQTYCQAWKVERTKVNLKQQIINANTKHQNQAVILKIVTVQQQSQLTQQVPLIPQFSISIITSISEQVRNELLQNGLCTLYTPQNQHFGIVPLESMARNVPVIAHRSGGPVQTIPPSCGFLCGDDQKEWAQKMTTIVNYCQKQQKPWINNGEGTKAMEGMFGFSKFKTQFMRGLIEIRSPQNLSGWIRGQDLWNQMKNSKKKR